MIKEIKEKIKKAWEWTKKKAKGILIALGIIGVVLAAPITDNQINPYTKIGEQYVMYLATDSRIRIGGEDINEFKPELHLGRWGDEAWIKISYPTDKKIKPKRDLFSNKIKWNDTDIEVHFYPLEPREFEENGRTVKQLEQGGFEFEVILKKKPTTNKIVLNIETKGLKFYYQPPLTEKITEEQKAKGWTATETEIKNEKGNVVYFRPENMVGAYVFYHKTQDKLFKTKTEGEKYKAGIFGTFYRPQMEDANGWKVWGELNIDIENGIQTITIPQDFIDNAVYPIRHATGEIFGYDTGGGSYHTGLIDTDLVGSVFESPSDITEADSVSVNARREGGFAEFKAVIVLHSNLNIVANGVSPEGSLGGSYTWETATYITKPSITATTPYVLMMIGKNNGDPWTNGLRYDEGDADQGHLDASNNYASPTNPSVSHSTNKYSIYCTYTPTGGVRGRIRIE